MKLDIIKWNTDRLKLEAEIKALKHSIRREAKPIQEYRQDPETKKYRYFDTGSKYFGGSYQEYKKLWDLKCQATYLYSIRAGARGKIHLKDGTGPNDDFGVYALPEVPVDQPV